MAGKIIVGATSAAKIVSTVGSPTNHDTIDATKTAALRTFYSALALRNSSRCNILVMGDSTTEGARCTNAQTRWIGRFRDQLRARMGQTAAGGYGYVPAWYSTGDQQTPSPATITSAGTDAGAANARSLFGFGRRCEAMNAAGPGGPTKSVLTLASGSLTACTEVDLWYAKASTATSGIDIYLDDVLQTSVVTNSASPASGLTSRISGLAGGTHTLEARATGATAYVEGWYLYNGDTTSGIHVVDGGSSGSNSLYHANISAAGKASPTFCYAVDDIAALQPALVIVMLGINDYADGTSTQTQTPAQYGANLTRIFANVRAACTVPPSIVVVHQYERGTPGTAVAQPWSAYRAAALAAVAADGAVVPFDAWQRFPAGPANSASGLFNFDNIHINDRGSGYQADSVVNYLLPR